MRIPHTKILGTLWLLFGGFWSVLLIWSLLTGAASITPRPQPGVTYSTHAWWQEVISNVLECSFFLVSALLGIALLCRWRWSNKGLGVLGAVLLAVWALLSVSPSSPPTTVGQSKVFLSPLLALALYSIAVTLVPNSQVHLSHRFKILIAGGSVFGIVGAIGFHLWAFREVPSDPAENRALWEANMSAFSKLDLERIRPAVDAFSMDRRSHRLALPTTVSFTQLVAQGYLRSSDLPAFSNADATVSLEAANTGSTAPWISVRWKGGAEITVPYVKPASR